MNKKLLIFAGLATGLVLQFCPAAMAQTTYGPFGSGTLDTLIPDNNASGIASQIDVSGVAGGIDSISVTLDIAGIPNANDAYNGDYYAYLQFGSGLDVLLDHIDTPPTFGSPGSGIDVTFADGFANIGAAAYTAGQPLTGTYAPQAGSFAGIEGLNDANGPWTLFVADTSPGGTGQLVSWSVAVTAPDNTSTLLLLAMGVGCLGLCSMRQLRLAPVSRK